jgi:dTDP-4-dehydrorhamnose reductase
MFDEVNHPRNFLSQLQQYAAFPDSLQSLSHRGDFVRACLDLWERKAPYGVYHIANPGTAPLHQVGEQIRAALRGSASGEQNIAVVRDTLDQPDCVLDTSKLRSAGIVLPQMPDSIRASLEHWKPAPAGNGSWPIVTTPAE